MRPTSRPASPALARLHQGLAACAMAAASLFLAHPAGAALPVTFPEHVTVQNTALQLNGAGVRYKTIFQVYAAGLYLPHRATTPQDVWAQKGPMRLHVTMLRDIDAGELGKLFSRGIEENMDPKSFSRIVNGVLRMSDVFTQHKLLRKGESFVIDWEPEKGMVLSVNGVVQGAPFREPEFFRALLGIWLGPHPADYRLKNALLGDMSPP